MNMSVVGGGQFSSFQCSFTDRYMYRQCLFMMLRLLFGAQGKGSGPTTDLIKTGILFLDADFARINFAKVP